jgi:hypothetical protein
MRSRLVLRGFPLFIALSVAVWLTFSASAQSAPVRVVQGSDGTLYVVQGGKSWTLVPDQIGDADLAALDASGEIDGTLPDSLLSTQAAAPAPAPAPAPPAPAAAPAPAPAQPAPVNGGPPQVRVQNPTEGQNVSARGTTTFTISGSATDPANGPRAIDSVDVWIFGERNASGGVDLGQANVQSDGSWSLSFQPTKFPSTHTNLYVYAHSRATGQTTEVQRGFNIVG